MNYHYRNEHAIGFYRLPHRVYTLCGGAYVHHLVPVSALPL